MDDQSKNHHYVPQALLKNFSINVLGKQVYVFDKLSGKVFTSSIEDAGSENYFNTVEVNGRRINFEPLFQEIDSIAPLLVKKIIKLQSLITLSDIDRHTLAVVAATQLLRTKLQRTSPSELIEQLQRSLERSGIDLNSIENLDQISDNDSRFISLKQLLELDKYVESFVSKRLLLLRTSESHPFWTSDNPIGLYNTFPYGEIGLREKGIEIYFPISTTLCVAFYCPSIEIKLKEALSNTRLEKGAKRDWLEGIYFGLKSLEAVDAIRSTIDFSNELQIRSSSRFLYSSISNFSLAEKVLCQIPQLRNVRSLYSVGEMGMPPPAKKNFPLGEYLVVFGANSHHILAIRDLSHEAEHPAITFSTHDLDKLRVIHQDSPFESVYVYRDGQPIRMMRDAEFEDVDYIGERPIRVKHRNEGLNQLLELINQSRK